MKSIPKQGVYIITDSSLCAGRGLVSSVQLALEGGASMVQYRDKTQNHLKRKEEALALVQLCDAFDVLFLVNDDIELATLIHADGVHIGKDDETLHKARTLLGNDKLIGVSCYNSIERATLATSQGADYIAFGRFFPSRIKPEAPKAELDTIRKAQSLEIPIAAIGGITLDKAPLLIAAGVNLLAVIGAVFGADDPKHATKNFMALFDGAHNQKTGEPARPLI